MVLKGEMGESAGRVGEGWYAKRAVGFSFIIWISKYNNESDLKASSTHKPLITCK